MNCNRKLESKRRKAKKRNARRAEYRTCGNSSPRTCGECRACCYVFPLIDKPENVWCKHATPEGCGCYDSRPEVCRSYWCLYLDDERCPPHWRPDKSGIIITSRGVFREHPVLCLSECWDNAISGPVGRDMLSALRTSNAIILYERYGGVAVCDAHTGLVLDADGTKELVRFIVDSTETELGRIAEEPFDFGDAPEEEPTQLGRPSGEESL